MSITRVIRDSMTTLRKIENGVSKNSLDDMVPLANHPTLSTSQTTSYPLIDLGTLLD